jgi:lipoprotein-releasing system permease protein
VKLRTLFFIALRLLISRQKMTAVSVISWIAVIGMVISTAAMVILLSAFNGIEGMIEELYSSFDQEVVVRSLSGRTMDVEKAKEYQVYGNSIRGVKNSSLFLQERVILRNKKKWSNAELWATQPSFMNMSEMNSKKHLINGALKSGNTGLIGVGLANRLMLQSMNQEEQPVVLYFPKQNKKVRFGTAPFYQRTISLSGAFDFNKEVNDNVLLVPLEWVYSFSQKEVSGVLFSTVPQNRNEVKNALSNKFSGQIEVLTNLEKNALIFKTSRSEKLIVLIILIFVFILSLFNLAASITMTFLEKKGSSITLYSLGMSRINLRNLYFLLGAIIVASGVFLGLLLGSFLVEIHERFGIIRMPGSIGFFPSDFSWTQTAQVMLLLIFLGTTIAFLTATYLIKPSLKERGSLILEE